MTRENVERIWASVVKAYSSGAFPAIALCIRRHGEVVLDRAIGHARGAGPGDAPGTPMVVATPDTAFCAFSAAKGVTAMVIHMLEERGLLRVGDRVADYLPEFGINGKAEITIAQVLSHRGGVRTMPKAALELDVMADERRVFELLCQATPESKPGTRQAYHAFSAGFILGELVHRVTGEGIREFLAAEVVKPVGIDLLSYGVPAERLPTVATNYSGPRPPSRLMLRAERHALGMAGAETVALSNDARFLSLVAPAGNLVATANSLSQFYELLRCEGELDGVRVFEPATIRRALNERSRVEIDRGLGLPIRFSGGFWLGDAPFSPYGRDTRKAFGHPGFAVMPAWADPERAVSAALLTSGKTVAHRGIVDYLRVTNTISREISKVN